MVEEKRRRKEGKLQEEEEEDLTRDGQSTPTQLYSTLVSPSLSLGFKTVMRDVE